MKPDIYKKITPLIQDVHYPASREEILEHVRTTEGSEEIRDVLVRIPPRLYESHQEVLTTLDMVITHEE